LISNSCRYGERARTSVDGVTSFNDVCLTGGCSDSFHAPNFAAAMPRFLRDHVSPHHAHHNIARIAGPRGSDANEHRNVSDRVAFAAWRGNPKAIRQYLKEI
jgi:hypothetical protein